MPSVKITCIPTVLIFYAILSTSCASAPDVGVSKAVQGIDDSRERDSTPELDGENLLIPSDSKRSPHGYVYAVIRKGTQQRPEHTDAVKVRLRLRNLEGIVLEEGQRILSIAHSTPLLEEILPLMHIGETYRVWGDNRDIWEIEMIAVDDTFRAPNDVAQPPKDADVVEEFPDVRWRVIESGGGETITAGEAVRIHISRWDSDGSILESSKLGRGMVYLLNKQSADADPLHTLILQKLTLGAHVRLWIPAQRAHLPFDIVEDLVVVEKLPDLKFPTFPSPSDGEILALRNNAKIAFEQKSAEPKLESGDSVKVDMTCWNAESGDIVEASYWHAEPMTMDIDEKLGIYFDIMTQIGAGDKILAQIPKEALPETVGMPLICRIHVIEKIEEESSQNREGRSGHD